MALLVGAASASPAGATVEPLTVASSWSQEPVVAGVTDGLTFTINDNDADDTPLSNVSFTDALPAGVVLDDEVGESGKNCGTVDPTEDAPGSSTITVTGLTVTNGSTCTLSFAVVGQTAGTDADDDISGLSFVTSASATDATPSTTDDTDVFATPAVLEVVADPSVTVTVPAANHTYGWGQQIDTSWSATVAADDSYDPTDLYGFDDQLDELQSGDPLNTWTPGSHSVTVFLTTADGGSVVDTVNYTVSGFTLEHVHTSKQGAVSFEAAFPFGGALSARVLDGRHVIGSAKRTLTAAGKPKLTIKPSAAGRRLLTRAGSKGVKVTLAVSFKPAGHASYTVKKTKIRLR